MPIISYDVETTTFQKGNPFSRRNRLVLAGMYFGGKFLCVNDTDISRLQTYLDESPLLVTFNSKFDIHWGRRYGLDFSKVKLWDCQLAEFLLSCQQHMYPSLDSCADKYELPRKLDIVKTEYWDKDIDTSDIPYNILREYLEYDCKLTYEVYLRQLEEFKKEPEMFKLFRLQCADALVLEEMEFNGLLIDVESCRKEAEKATARIEEIEKELRIGYESIPINFNSNYHLSCFLYGGTISDDVREPIGVFKTGNRIGQVRYKIVTFKYDLPQLVKPLKGSELLEDGYYSTNEATLRSLKGNKALNRKLSLLFERSKLSKLCNTYFKGIRDLIEEMDWDDGRIYGTYNQCVARTGRIASSRPNQQNFPEEFKRWIISEDVYKC